MQAIILAAGMGRRLGEYTNRQNINTIVHAQHKSSNSCCGIWS